MAVDIRIPADFPFHRKTRRLVKRLGEQAIRCLITLWIYAANRRPDGNLTGMTAEDISDESHWEGDPQDWLDALVEIGWLDRNGEQIALHEWALHQPWVSSAPARSEKAKRAAAARHGQPASKAKDVTSKATSGSAQAGPLRSASYEHATSMQQADDTDAQGSAPSPCPDPIPLPSPSPAPSHAPAGEDAAASGSVEVLIGPSLTAALAAEDAAQAAEKGPLAPRAPLEGFDKLVGLFARLADVSPVLPPYRLTELRNVCDVTGLGPLEIVADVEAWEATKASAGKPAPKISSPNFLVGIVQERRGGGAPRGPGNGKQPKELSEKSKAYLI